MKLDIDDAENFRGDVKVVAIEDLRALLKKDEKKFKREEESQVKVYNEVLDSNFKGEELISRLHPISQEIGCKQAITWYIKRLLALLALLESNEFTEPVPFELYKKGIYKIPKGGRE